MKITLCGSIAFYAEMQQAKNQLESMGHEVKLPPTEVPDKEGKLIPVTTYYLLRKAAKKDDAWIWDRKEQAMREHFEKIVWSDAILVLNETKHDILNYVGGNTLMEMGVAFHLKKKIYLSNPIPEMAYTEEIIGMRPIVIQKNLLFVR